MVSAENALVNHFILNISFGNSFVVVLLFIALILSRAFAELLLQMSYDRKIFSINYWQLAKPWRESWCSQWLQVLITSSNRTGVHKLKEIG